MAEINDPWLTQYFNQRPQLQRPAANALGFVLPYAWKCVLESLLAERAELKEETEQLRAEVVRLCTALTEVKDETDDLDCEGCQVRNEIAEAALKAQFPPVGFYNPRLPEFQQQEPVCSQCRKREWVIKEHGCPLKEGNCGRRPLAAYAQLPGQPTPTPPQAAPNSELALGAPTTETSMDYKVQVYVEHGYFEYEVPTAEKATAHAQKIMQAGVYRRAIPGGLECHKPYMVRATGPGLESQYQDRFCRT